MRVRVLAFARLREVLGFGARDIEVADGATVEMLWGTLAGSVPALTAFRPSTRFARNGELTDAATRLHAGDEIALLPPVGGG